MSIRIENIDLAFNSVTEASKNKIIYSKRDAESYDVFPATRKPDENINIRASFDRSYSEKAEVLRELISNKSFATVNISNDVDDFYTGLYLLKSGNISQSGGKHYVVSLNLEGPFTTYNYIVGNDLYTTGFDNFETWTTSDPNWSGTYSWLSGTMTIATGNTVYSTIDDIYSDYSIYGKVGCDSTTSSVDIIFRRHYASAEYYYKFTVDWSDSTITFSPSSTGISRSWDIEELFGYTLEDWDTDNKEYFFKIVCQSHSFDIFFEDENGLLKYIGTVHDDNYKAGMIGIYSNGGNAKISSIIIDKIYPVDIHTPIGAYDINTFTNESTAVLEDDDGSLGVTKTISGKIGSIKFRQDNFTGDFNTIGGNVIVYDTNQSASESDWQIVRDTGHVFNGDIVIDNSYIRLNPNLTSGILKFSVWSNNAWVEVQFDPTWSSLTRQDIEYSFISIDKHRVILREVSYYASGGNFDTNYTDYIITTGCRFVQIENKRNI